MKRFAESLLSSLMLVLMLMVGGSAKAEATLGSKLTSLDQLSNGKFYAIHNTNNEGFWCYNQTVNQHYLGITGVTNDGGGVVSNAAAHEAYHAAYNAADVNGQWQIIQISGVYYVYNVGAQKYLTRSGGDYLFTETATAIDGIKVVSEGVFAFHAGGGMSDGSLNYACIVTKNAPNAVRFWNYSDHGSTMWISEIEDLEEDLTVANTLEEVAKQAARTTAFNELLGNVKTAYNGNFTYTKGADIITDANWFSSNATEPNEGKITNLIDNDCTTFWHSSWSATNGAAVAFHNHYLQVSLPDAIEGQTQMTMGRRVNEGSFCDDNPVRMSVTFSADDATYSEPTYFDTPFNQTIEDPYVKAIFDVPAGTKFLRFYSEQSNGSSQRGYWHCGEFQLNPVTLDAECANATHPLATAAMLAAIEAAEGIDAATVTEAQLEALQTAYDTYVAALEQPEGGEEGGATSALFDFAANPWNHGVSSSSSSEGVMAEGATLLGDDNATTLTFSQGENTSNTFRFWLANTGVQMRGYSKNTCTVDAPAGKTIESITVTGVSGKLFTGAGFETSGTTSTITFTEPVESYTITLTGNCQWTSLEVAFAGNAPQTKTVDVTYTVKFGEQTLKTETITETVGQAPTFALEAPAYVTVSGMPETIAEETTAVTVETALNEQAPFAVGSTYNFFFHPNDNYYFWKDNGETDAREEFVTTNSVSYREAEAAKYEWTVGGDWMNGFTFVNANGNYINAPEGVAASSNAQLTAEATTKYVLVANGEKWHVAIKGNEGIFLAHVGHNGGNPYLQFWNVASYNGGDLYVKAPETVTATSTKTVTITFVTPSGDKYLLNNNEGTQNTIAYTEEAPASAQFEATLWSNGKYTYTNNGQYVGFRRMDSEFKANLNEWEVLSLEGVENSNITETVPAGSVYLKVANRSGSDNSAGVMIVANADGSFANTNAPYFNGTFTSAIFVEEYTEPTPAQPINLEQVYLQSKSGQYFALAGGQVAVSEEPYAMTFTARETKDSGYGFLTDQKSTYSLRNYDNTHWINSGTNGWLSTAAISQTNNILNYYFYEATITETGVKGTLVEHPVKGKDYMVVVLSKKTDASKGFYAMYSGTVSSNAQRFDVVRVSSDNTVVPEEFTLTAEDKHEVVVATAGSGLALEDFNKVVWNIVEPASEPDPKDEFPVEGKAYVVKNVESQLFLNVIEHDAKATVLGTQPEKFFFTKKDGAWVIKNEEGLYVGGHSNTWNMSSSIEQLWKVVEVEGGYAFERADAAGKYIGFNNLTVDPDDATKTAAYRDKSYTANHGVFSIFEYTFPLQGEAYKVKNVDAGYYMHITDLEAKNVTIEKQPQKIFFTVAEEGGYYIQNEEGHYVGAGANDWTVGNTKTAWNVVEVEGGYAFQRLDNTSKYLGLDSESASAAYYRDKGASNHYAHLIMLFDTPETTPLEDLQAAIDAAKAIKAEDYATVPEDLFVDLATEIARAEALAQQGEDAAVSDINAEIAALEAAVAAITEYTEPSQEELVARLQTALAAARAAVEANYSGETALAGLPGYKPAAVVEALEAAIAQYGETEGELTRDMVVEVEHAVRNYNEAEVCIPEVGKTYLIRNHTADVGKGQGFSYVITAGAEGLELNSYPSVEKVQNKHLWTVSEKTFTVEDDYGEVIAKETRYIFTNVATGQMFGYTGSTFGLIDGSNEPTMQTSWNYITKTPKEIVSGSQGLTYGTLGLTFDNGANHNRVLSVDMRTDYLKLEQGDLMQHGLWNTYSSAFIFEVCEPVEDILSFEFADNGDGTYTITPSNNEDTYFACVTSDAINTEYEVADDAGMFEFNCYYVIDPETDAYKGAITINPVEWIDEWFEGYVTPEPGEYRLLAAKIKLVQEEYEGDTYEWYEADGDIATYTFTIQDTEGLGTVLSAEAGKHIFNLKGVRQNTLQRGINIVAGKKVLK